MVTLQHVSYLLPNREHLFSGINLSVQPHEKIALIGNNGTGKSTLLSLITGTRHASEGQVIVHSTPYLVPQVFGQYNQLTVAQALNIDEKLSALNDILNGKATETNLEQLADDWTIDERCREAFTHWRLPNLDLNSAMEQLSGGQKNLVFLAGLQIHQPDLVLMDEPTNHLDAKSRDRLYQYIESTRSTLLIVSHDRKLLSMVDTTCELTPTGINVYGGNYAFYREQKKLEENALNLDIQAKEKALRKAKEKERDMKERQQRLEARGKEKQVKARVARILINTIRNKAENSTSKLKDVHAEKISNIFDELQNLRQSVPDAVNMKFRFDPSSLHTGKVLLTAHEVNFSYAGCSLWATPLSFQIKSGERLSIKGDNGSGKTTLIKLMLGTLQPQTGSISTTAVEAIYIDQDYSLINNQRSVYEQAAHYDTSGLEEHEIKIRLHRFLFTKEAWDKPCSVLSGGERMRLMLCCLNIKEKAPDMIVLDEPTNNLDIQNIDILTAAINDYQGTLIVVSHDESFLEHINIEREIGL